MEGSIFLIFFAGRMKATLALHEPVQNKASVPSEAS